MWICAALVASIFGTFIPNNLIWLHVFVGVLFQEMFRWLMYKLVQRAEDGLNLVSKEPNHPHNKSWLAYSTGMGFGLTAGAIMFVTPLALSLGPGTYFLEYSCSRISAYYIDAWLTSVFIYLNIAWMIIAFEGYRRRSWPLILWVIIGHYVASFSVFAFLFTNSMIKPTWTHVYICKCLDAY